MTAYKRLGDHIREVNDRNRDLENQSYSYVYKVFK